MAHDLPKNSEEKAPRNRWRWWLVTFLVLLGLDGLRPPQKQVSARVLLASINVYQATLSPILARSGTRCRFLPSCSHYGEDALRHYGTFKGGGKAAWRVLRCGPWTPSKTMDPAVPRQVAPPEDERVSP